MNCGERTVLQTPLHRRSLGVGPSRQSQEASGKQQPEACITVSQTGEEAGKSMCKGPAVGRGTANA